MGTRNVKKGRVPGFAKRLENTRIDARYTSPAKLAKALGLSAQRVQTWEYERGEPGLVDLVRLCKGLDVSADYLLGLTDEPRRTPPPPAAPAIIGNSNGGSNTIGAGGGYDCPQCNAVVSTLREAINALAEQLRRNP